MVDKRIERSVLKLENIRKNLKTRIEILESSREEKENEMDLAKVSIRTEIGSAEVTFENNREKYYDLGLLDEIDYVIETLNLLLQEHEVNSSRLARARWWIRRLIEMVLLNYED